MSIQLKGKGGKLVEVDNNFFAIPVTQRPIDVGVLGSYRKTLRSGTMVAGLAANSPIGSFRHSGANLCLVRQVSFSAGGIAAFTAGIVQFDLFVARGFTASDAGAGSLTATFTGDKGKMRTSMVAAASVEVADFRISNTATLTVGNRTLDDDPMAAVTGSVSNVAGTPLMAPVDLFNVDGSKWPLVLKQDEGLVLQATVPANGSWKFSFGLAFDIVLPAQWPQGA